MKYHLILVLVLHQELFLLSICTDEFISAPKMITLFPTLSFVNEDSERESNSVP